MITRARTLIVVPAVAGALALGACSSPYGSSSAAAPAPTTTTIEGASTPALTKAADLRANLTYLLVEHGYLLGAVTTDYATGTAPSADTTAGLAANSTDLANAFSKTYGPSFAAEFSPLWAARIADIEAYAQARDAKDNTQATAATTQLTADVLSLANLIHTTNQYLFVHTVTNPATGIDDEFTSDDQAALALVDAQATNDPTVYTKLVAAAETMPHTAEVLAAAAAKLYPTIYPGTTTGTAANLRATLTGILVEHVELGSLTFGAAASGAQAGPQTLVLSANTLQLHNAFSAMFDDPTATTFSLLWGQQVSDYLAYAQAAALKDSAAATTAKANLAIFEQKFGAFLSGALAGKVPASSATSSIQAQVNAVLAVIDGAVTGVPDEFVRVRTAAALAPGLATEIAEPVAEITPTRYLP